MTVQFRAVLRLPGSRWKAAPLPKASGVASKIGITFCMAKGDILRVSNVETV